MFVAWFVRELIAWQGGGYDPVVSELVVRHARGAAVTLTSFGHRRVAILRARNSIFSSCG